MSATHQFHHFFPAWDPALTQLMVANCSTQADKYDSSRRASYAAISCLLDAIPNFRLLEMSVSAVILGSVPQLIQMLGVTTLQNSVVSLRRPFLAFLLSVGSPAVKPLHPDAYLRELKGLEDPVAGYLPAFLTNDTNHGDGSGRSNTSRIATFITIVEYLLVLAAVANVAALAWQLGYWSASIIAVGQTWLPAFWTYLSCAVHLAGVVVFFACVRVEAVKRSRRGVRRAEKADSRADEAKNEVKIYNGSNDETENEDGGDDGYAHTKRPPIWHAETTPSLYQTSTVRLRMRSPDSFLAFYMLTWLLYICTALHFIFGITVLASLIFISAADSAGIVARYAASTIVCRLVVAFEVMGMSRNGLHLKEYEQKEGSNHESLLGECSVTNK